jgi:hypothetical protein
MNRGGLSSGTTLQLTPHDQSLWPLGVDSALRIDPSYYARKAGSNCPLCESGTEYTFGLPGCRPPSWSQ